jgi:hypothetical protein
MNLQEQINQAETRIFKTVFQILQITTILYLRNSSFMMDEVAFITATLLEKRCNCFFWQNWFYQAHPAGTIIELIGT